MLTSIIVNQYIFTLIFTLSLVLIAIEVFTPSFGLIGITGIYLLIESILAIGNIENAFIFILISILLSTIIMLFIVKKFINNIHKNKLVLNTNLSKAKGNGTDYKNKDLIGKTAIVNKTLRPSGEVEIEQKIYEAITYGDFIEKGKEVIVDKIEGNKIYCIKKND